MLPCLKYSRTIAFTLLATYCCLAAASAYEIKSDMQIDPRLESRPTQDVFLPEFKEIWLEALGRPEVDYQRRALLAVTEAHRAGMPDLKDTAPRIMALVSSPETHPVVRQAAVLALIEFDDPQAAAVLDQAAQQHGVKIGRLVEPQLAVWSYQPIRARWLERLSSPQASRELQSLAIAGLGQVGERVAVEPLRAMMFSENTPPDLRLASAQALGNIADERCVTDAKPLASSSEMIDRLCAVSLLSKQAGASANKLLFELARDMEPAIVAAALTRILEIDPSLAAPLWSGLAQSTDVKVRQRLADIMFQDAKPESIKRLAHMLDDPHPGIRDFATNALIRLAAQQEFDSLVREAMMTIIAGQQARPMELAIVVLGSLRHQPAANRLVQLLSFETPAVTIAAAWALSQLALPETGEPIQQLVERHITETDAAAAKLNAAQGVFDVPDFSHLYVQHEHLLIALGKMQHKPALPILAKYLPKPPLLKETDPPYVETYRQQQLRAAAIWALGKYFGKEAPPNLSNEIFGRATDDSFTNAEAAEVRAMACVATGRFGRDDAETIEILTELRDSELSQEQVASGAAWALGQLTGGPVVPLKPRSETRLDWFLRHLSDQR